MVGIEPFMHLHFVNPIFGLYLLINIKILTKTMFKYQNKSGPSFQSGPYLDTFRRHCTVSAQIERRRSIKI